MYAVNLYDVDKNSINLVGGKGANLGELIRAEFPVPKGFSITSAAYDEYIKNNHLEDVIAEALIEWNAAPQRRAEIAADLMGQIQNGEIPADMLEHIRREYSRMGKDVSVAVRSSATAEDLPQASFAGQQETYLNIRGFKQLITAVKNCFASLWTERAMQYRKETGFDKEKISLAVVVQEMVEGDVSGVLFTANPVTINSDEMAINASYGLGESIVSGIVTPDFYVWDKKTGRLKEQILGAKEHAVVSSEDGSTIEKNNGAAEQSRYCLTEGQICMLTAMGMQIENHYGLPQDIEWTIKGDSLYILQSRGITTLKKEESQSEETNAFDVENMIFEMLIDFYPEPPYPLELAPICTVFNGFAADFRKMGLNLEENPVTVQKDGTYQIRAVSKEEGSVNFPEEPQTEAASLAEPISFKKNMARVNSAFGKIRGKLAALTEVDFNGSTAEELKVYLKQLMALYGQMITVRFSSILDPSINTKQWISKQLEAGNLAFSEYDMLSGLEYKTMEMNHVLNALAEAASKDQALREEIKGVDADRDPNTVFEELTITAPYFTVLCKEVLKEYGWKSTNSHQYFSARSWNEDIGIFLQMLRAAMEPQNKPVKQDKYEDICRQIKSGFAPEAAGKLLEKMEEFRTYHQKREESLYLLETIYGLSRCVLKEMTARWPELFSDYEDILYLTMDEVYTLDKGNVSEVKVKIKTRRNAREFNQSMWHGMEERRAPAAPLSVDLKGGAGGSGRAEGTVRIVGDITEFHKLRAGDILVCKSTDPMWTPLFAAAKAVVTDTGGPLSHSAIVAREYGIPAVLGCGNATKQLRDGQRILVDGDTGVVTILSDSLN